MLPHATSSHGLSHGLPTGGRHLHPERLPGRSGETGPAAAAGEGEDPGAGRGRNGRLFSWQKWEDLPFWGFHMINIRISDFFIGKHTSSMMINGHSCNSKL